MDLSWLAGHAKTTFHHADETITLPSKNRSGSKDTSSISLAALCQDITPPCQLNPLLFNGHLQTMYTVVRSEAVPVHYRRRIFQSNDLQYPGSFAVDFVTHTPAQEEDKTLYARTSYYTEEEWKNIAESDSRPMLVTLHGLAGGSQEMYLRHVLSPLINAEAEGTGQQWEACVVTARGCSNAELTSRFNFNARATWDVRQVVEWLRVTFPNRPLFGIGFSLGANILVNYLAEEGDKCKLQAAVVCSNPWNLETSSHVLKSTFLGKRVYSKHMADGMKALFQRHIEQLSKNPGIDADEVRKSRYLHEFDRAVQTHIWGYPTEGAYYRDASSTDPLMAVKIPLFAINATDDPIAPLAALPLEEVRQNPYAVLCCTNWGGHLSWFETGGGRWFVKPVVNFLRKMSEDVDHEAFSRQSHSEQHVMLRPDNTGRVFDPIRRKLCSKQ